MFEICSKSTIKTPELSHWCLSGVSTVNFGNIANFFGACNVDFEHEMEVGQNHFFLWKYTMQSCKIEKILKFVPNDEYD